MEFIPWSHNLLLSYYFFLKIIEYLPKIDSEVNIIIEGC